MEQHYRFSSYREKLIEHLFIGELLKMSWLRGECSLEVAKPEVDSRGYDVIIERNGVVRHIQLKTSHRTANATGQKVHIGLGEKPAGCVVWIQFDESTLELGPFLFYGDSAGGPLPRIVDFKIARHVKANAQGIKAERPEIRVVAKSRFVALPTIEDVFGALFGCQASNPLEALQSSFHALIRDRLDALRVQLPALLPELPRPLPPPDAPAWWPVPGMYGGFSYWGDGPEDDRLVVESWSRVLGGSGQRHEVSSSGSRLVEEGFV